MQGNADELITPAQTAELEQLFEHPQILEHEQGHCVPQRSADTKAILGFLKCRAPSRYGSMLSAAAEEQLHSETAPVLFVRDDHTSSAQQLLLSAKLPRLKGLNAQLWLEIFTSEQLEKVREAFLSMSKEEMVSRGDMKRG